MKRLFTILVLACFLLVMCVPLAGCCANPTMLWRSPVVWDSEPKTKAAPRMVEMPTYAMPTYTYPTPVTTPYRAPNPCDPYQPR